MVLSIEDKDKKYTWHPFTQMKGWMEEDIVVIERGEGVYLYDTKGRKYIDGVSSLWCNVHGHRVKAIDEAIRAQLDKLAHSTFLGLSNVPAVELAEKLVSIAPKGLSRVFYSDSGSEAMEIALKMAYQYWQQLGDASLGDEKLRRKRKFVTLTEAYHGDTVGAVSLGGIELFHAMYQPLLFETIKVVPTVEAVERALAEHHEEVAGVVLEPLIQGAGGMLLEPPGFLSAVRKLCDRYNVLMIVDEVATGFGRTGKMFACEHEGVTPDIIAVAKGLTGGYLPLAATLTTERVFEAFLGEYSEFKAFFHGHTYTANPLACAAAFANLRLFEDNRTLEKLQSKIDFLWRELKQFSALEHVGEVRQLGLVAGIQLMQSKTPHQPYPPVTRMGHRVVLEARKRGLILRPLLDIIVLMPPLAITETELKQLLDITFSSIQAATRELW